ncbi:Processing alpha glucosidase I [Pichia californica]|uniref:Mannosyl-oligosaccharide glucosidase n=1 Tax=Pichia californica TaxID=460514 RepID=A0A9P6WQ19_9ASCO|nr:Processing alpha glucosidase I [[Candida] californica]
MFVSIWYFLIFLFGFANSQTLDNFDKIAEEYEKLNQESLNWGPYRSNLYVGVRPRIPNSLLSGLLWFPAETFQGPLLSKHSCEQSHNIKKFGWTRYDPRFGGIENIIDNDSHLNLTTEFVKTDDGLNWALRVKGTTVRSDAVNSIVFYAGLQGDGKLGLASDLYEGTNNLVDGDVTLKGFMEKLNGDFTIDIIDDDMNVYPDVHTIPDDETYDPTKTHYTSLMVPEQEVWKASEIFWALVRINIQQFEDNDISPIAYSPIELLQLRNSNNFKGNFNLIQKTFVGNFQFDIIYNTEVSKNKIEREDLSNKIEDVLNIIDTKFTKKFQLSAPFNTNKFIDFAKEILSQLMGGIIYQHGDQIVDRKAVLDDVKFSHTDLSGSPEGQYELFTCVPSRPFFPRGFYWDEGFHLLPILEYDSDLTLEIVKSWFSLIDDKGWIAREQILGDESRSKVPIEFTTQNPNIANPPTLMMIFSELLDSAKKFQLEYQLNDNGMFQIDDLKNNLGDLHMEKPELMINYAKEIYPKLQTHYEWFRSTQRGNTRDFERHYPNNDEVYRWKGRSQELCLPSGIDDYPRCEADISELNIDLLSWMGVMTRSMFKIAQLLEIDEDAKLYKKRFDDIISNIEKVHWSKNKKMYCDVTVDDDDDDIFECHEGYVTIMPFIHKLIPISDTEKLTAVIESINNPDKLWSDFGIRSLSKQDSKFHKGEDYWRGHIWININYLTLEALRYYGEQDDVDSSVKELANKVYIQLRENLVNNIYDNYESTGYAWEQYNEESGAGQRTRHFLGWTSLVILMMKMPSAIL